MGTRDGGAGGFAILAAVLVGLNIVGLRDRLFGPATPKIESLAVLPLDNLSGDPEQEYFAEGVREALTTELSKISALKVISRTSAMRYKKTDKPVPQIAQELDVDALIEGSVAREGDQVRITVQLIHGPTDKQLWAESYQREVRSILILQSDVAREIARQIKIAVTPAEAARLVTTRSVNPKAHELYLKGRFHWNKRSEEGLQKATAYFQQALEQDPRFALGYAGLADSYLVMAHWEFLSGREAYPKAKAAASKALELDNTLVEAHTALATVSYQYSFDWTGAEKQFKRALELNPGYATGHQWYAEYLSAAGRHQEAIAEIKRAQELDPFSLIVNAIGAFVFYFARQYDEAIDEGHRTLELDSNFYPAYIYLFWAYEQKGMHEQ
ncbi:MAG: tetratricopeptide repeat protein, partial [Acidobacteria bacterium]|nr:tetratricopeptide repeat protein [Acidobacteriota bacterium]